MWLNQRMKGKGVCIIIHTIVKEITMDSEWISSLPRAKEIVTIFASEQIL